MAVFLLSHCSGQAHSFSRAAFCSAEMRCPSLFCSLHSFMSICLVRLRAGGNCSLFSRQALALQAPCREDIVPLQVSKQQICSQAPLHKGLCQCR